jgi:hypothetical protein
MGKRNLTGRLWLRLQPIDFDCNKTLCGCSSDQNVNVTMKFTNSEGDAVSGARLICHDNGEFLGTTNPNGLVKLRVAGAATPGCGFMPNCQVAYLRMKDGTFGRPYWFARFVRGEDVETGDNNIERISSGIATSQ